MAHTELVEKIYSDLQQHRIPKKAVDEMVNEIFHFIENRLAEDKPFAITNFGRWCTFDAKEKVGCHPQTKEPILIPATKKVRFKPSKQLTSKLK